MARLSGAKKGEKKEKYFRVNLTLPIELDRTLSDVGPITWSKGGSKIPKTVILRALIRMFMELDVDLAGVRTEEEFLERLRESIIKYRKKK